MVALYLSGSKAINLRLSSLRPTPGAPISTIGRKTPGLGNNRATSSYVGISSRSNSSLSRRSYMIFLVLVEVFKPMPTPTHPEVISWMVEVVSKNEGASRGGGLGKQPAVAWVSVPFWGPIRGGAVLPEQPPRPAIIGPQKSSSMSETQRWKKNIQKTKKKVSDDECLHGRKHELFL